MSNFLFAIDTLKEEVIVSESAKGSKTIHFIERISRKENDLFYSSVKILSAINQSSDFDLPIFKAMDKVCQMMYSKKLQSK